MNRLSIFLAVCGVFLSAVFASQAVAAQQTTLTEEHTERIRQNCVAAQTVLKQLFVSDAGMRVNRGQLYENISTKLMAPLNSRITMERLGGLELIATTLEYDQQMDTFRANYRQYYDAMNRTLNVDCVSKPVEFYENVGTARELRNQLHSDTTALTGLAQKYKAEFEAFAAGIEDEA